MQRLKYISVFALISIIFFSSIHACCAHPASTIQLSYDKEKEILHISIDHVTHRPRKHLIRKLIIYKNDKEVSSRSVIVQTSPRQLKTEVSISALLGYKIDVKAICSEAGIKTASVVIK